MESLNPHKLAVEICKREGKKQQVSIAQVKEILRVLVEILEEQSAWIDFTYPTKKKKAKKVSKKK